MTRRAAWIAALIVLGGQAGFGQFTVPVPADVNNLAHQMAERVRHLGEDIASDLAQAPNAAHLLQDTRELAQAVDEFHDSVHDNPDPTRARQAFAGIDGTWQHLRAQLAQPGVATPAVGRAAGHVDQLAAQLRQSLGLNNPPVGFYGAPAAPTGLNETRRLAHALAERAAFLAATAQAELTGNPNAAGVVQDAANLARAADQFHDALDANQPANVVAQAFAPVDTLADRVEQAVVNGQGSPRLQAAWQSFAAVEVLIHRDLGLQSPQPAVALQVFPQAGGGPSPIAALAEQLVEQTNAFVQVFSQTARAVPEGGAFLADAQRLQASAANFRNDAARGLNPGQLAFEFRDVDADWQRLARRTNRIARGRSGPNIEQVSKLGAICEQIHRALGMPGYPPAYSFPR